MNTSTESHSGLTKARNCHRVAVAVDDFDGAMSLWRDAFGFGTMMASVTDDLDGSQMGIVWAGNMPLLALSSTDPEGTVGRYLSRNGPSVQSLAWEIDDMWTTDQRLRQANIGITGVHIEGRHFFMHPKDTFGLLLEFTDDVLPLDPRRNNGSPEPVEGIIPVKSIAWVTAAVKDIESVVAGFDQIFGEEFTFANQNEAEQPDGSHETGGQVLLGDLEVRIVQPTDDRSRFASLVTSAAGRLHSVGLAVDDFDNIETYLSKAGIAIESRTDTSVWSNPSSTQGIIFEFVASS